MARQADFSGSGIYLAVTNTYRKTTERGRTGFGDAELTLLCALCERMRGCVIFLGEGDRPSPISIGRGCDWDDGFNTGCPRWKGEISTVVMTGETTRRSRGWVDRHGGCCGFGGSVSFESRSVCGFGGAPEDLERVCVSVVVGVRFVMRTFRCVR